ncbi:DUF4054 domain-containing protein [Bordetella avium]|uniref:Phage protein n=2 Tax=Bordetella avium TaxID=521 RepID=Q2L2W1_BORA1|nr:DUF4054 domain-containing protein [Bordetella avium]UOK17076.1 hypothetical protein vBBaMIFTN2_10 [Bordetella phage vB_BaM-IFTN2]UOK17139.1 hypothetical protein vBBaMIFTN3_10 [Bordetella phage vB_BaM-IFTN3]UOK17202.1 hypothetical protein vBBaMIFTN4_10 [Bordetella phage vB_BaM-IFTN4]UOK17274.1 hypothetical protein vBBaMIFTN5_10 [Bordetella phage vB_BaM-IFTN5]UOK17343.1 hypothetical protein vBBaMIFTN6_10 [Bordetella phage vB_BaM-IFTN6]
MTFPLTQFRAIFPAFASVTDEVVIAVADWGQCYVSSHGCDCNDKLWMLVTAHLLQLRANAEVGNSAPGALASATIDKVSVSFQAPPAGSSWAHWLNQTPYGQQFQALSRACSAGGMYVGGLPERAAFRNVGGLSVRGGRVR